jgi:hypothetical protein
MATAGNLRGVCRLVERTKCAASVRLSNDAVACNAWNKTINPAIAYGAHQSRGNGVWGLMRQESNRDAVNCVYYTSSLLSRRDDLSEGSSDLRTSADASSRGGGNRCDNGNSGSDFATDLQNVVDNGENFLDGRDELLLEPALLVGISGERKVTHGKFC